MRKKKMRMSVEVPRSVVVSVDRSQLLQLERNRAKVVDVALKVFKDRPGLPKISDLLYKPQGFTYTTAIDLSMGYYHIPLDEEAQKLCTTTLPWGKYRYRKLPISSKVL